LEKFTPPDTKVEIPKKTVDISILIRDIYDQIKKFFVSNGIKKLTFSKLVPSQDKDDKIYTFIPLLHLDSQRKIEVNQQEHLGEIDIALNRNYRPEKAPETNEASDAKNAVDQAVS
jgi:chromatin segregation and condensation protein Rec8/ScpA/Scc1 (kleisin family)